MINDIYKLYKNSGLILVVYIIALLTSTYNSNVYLVFLFCIFGLILLPIRKYLDNTALTILIFSIVYATFTHFNGVSKSMFQLLCNLLSPTIFYIFGKHIVKKNTKKEVVAFIAISLFAFSIMAISDVIKDIGYNGFANITRQIETSGREASLSATLFALVFSLNICGLGVFISYNDKKTIIPYFFLALCIASLVSNMHLINRTAIVLFVLVTLISIMYKYRKNIFFILFSIALVTIIIMLLFKYGIISSDVIEAYEQRALYDEINDRGLTSERDVRWILSIKNIFIYPFGWRNELIGFNPYAHNLWLDVARDAGFFPFTILIIASCMSIKDILRISLSNFKTYNAVLTLLYITFFISSFVEPVIQGIPLYFYLFTMLWGISRQSIINKYV